ncbi:MAG: glycosyltransferase family 39 protein [Tepidisphaeraceae bacterium]
MTEKPEAISSSTSSLRLSVSSSLGFACCTVLLAAFALTSWFAWLHKSSTYDEPLHLVAAWIQTYQLDFRCDADNPPLWKFYVAAGTRRDDLRLDRGSEAWTAMLSDMHAEWSYARQAMYQTPGNDPDALIRAGRARMIVLGTLLGALIAWWAWRLAGPLAAVVATAFFALDPNFLAHSPLIKNDVPITLLFLALMAVIWRVGQRATWTRCVALALLLGATLMTKFSGVLAIPMLLLALLARAVAPDPWPVLKWTAASVAQRLAAAAALAAGALLFTYLFIWACYAFRFSSAPGAVSRSDDIARACVTAECCVQHNASVDVSGADLERWRSQWHPSLTLRTVQWIERDRLLPQAWTRGFLGTYVTSLARIAFLCGRAGLTGWWYYFPLAFLFKTPLATLLGLFLALLVWLFWTRRDWVAPRRWIASPRWWTRCALLIAPALYMAAALRSHVDVGLRHIFPVYPFLFIFLGVVAAEALRRYPRPARWIVSLLILGLAVETYSAFPDYIPFFNVAAGGWRGGAALLSDSNIDWGQELPALARWQRAHPDRQLFLCYFGSADPRYYGIHYVNLGGSNAPDDQQPRPELPPVAAVSVMAFQGQYLNPAQRKNLDPLRPPGAKPIDVLGGCLYIYDHW